LLESAAAAAPGIGFAIGGLLTATVSPRLAYVAAAAGTAVVVAVWMRRPIVPRATPAAATPPPSPTPPTPAPAPVPGEQTT
jgi:hypothetical protein